MNVAAAIRTAEMTDVTIGAMIAGTDAMTVETTDAMTAGMTDVITGLGDNI